MSKYVFEDAKFGDKFKMRNGKMAIYHMKDKLYANDSHILINAQDTIPFKVDDSGKMLHIKSEHCFDIVSNWDKLIDKEKLDELAQEANIQKSLYRRTNDWVVDDFFREGFKSGYRKAMEG